MRNKELAYQRYRRYYLKNKEKIKLRRVDYHKKYRAENKERVNESARHSWVRRTYGLTPAQYDSMVREQNGLCKICSNPPSMRLCVDHNHKTGKIRGLLCHSCNNAMGLLKENQTILHSMIKYLEQTNS